MGFIPLAEASRRAEMHPASLRRIVRHMVAEGIMVEDQHVRNGPRRAYEINEDWLDGWLASRHRAPRDAREQSE